MQTIPEKGTRELTPRQVLALKYWREDKHRSKARAMRKAGYSEAMARQPHKLFDSPAVRYELYLLGLGDRISRNKKESGMTVQEWKQELVAKEKRSKQIDEAIRNITPEQVSVLRERLEKEVGYVSTFKTRDHVSTNYVPKNNWEGRDIFEVTPKINQKKFPSYSSM